MRGLLRIVCRGRDLVKALDERIAQLQEPIGLRENPRERGPLPKKAALDSVHEQLDQLFKNQRTDLIPTGFTGILN